MDYWWYVCVVKRRDFTCPGPAGSTYPHRHISDPDSNGENLSGYQSIVDCTNTLESHVVIIFQFPFDHV